MDEAIKQLETEKPHLAEIAMLRYFTGLSVEETAAVLGVSPSTFAREWRFAVRLAGPAIGRLVTRGRDRR